MVTVLSCSHVDTGETFGSTVLYSVSIRTVHVGFLWVFVLLILAASISKQNLPLFGHSLRGRLAHCALPTYFSVIITVIYTTHTITQMLTSKLVNTKLPAVALWIQYQSWRSLILFNISEHKKHVQLSAQIQLQQHRRHYYVYLYNNNYYYQHNMIVLFCLSGYFSFC